MPCERVLDDRHRVRGSLGAIFDLGPRDEGDSYRTNKRDRCHTDDRGGHDHLNQRHTALLVSSSLAEVVQICGGFGRGRNG